MLRASKHARRRDAAAAWCVLRGSRRARAPQDEEHWMSVPHLFSMFQKLMLGETSTPETFLRKATGATYCPSGIWVGASAARRCTASAIAFCFAGSVSLAKASRRRSIPGAHLRPKVAFSQLAFR